MKKLILFLIAMIAVSVSLSAQNVIVLSDANLSYKYAGTSVDTASAAGAYSKIITPNSTFSLWYNMSVKIKEVSGTTSTPIVLKARMFDTDAWTTIATVTYRGTGTDTTATFQEITTKKSWGQYGIFVSPANGKVTLLNGWIKATFRK